MKKAFLSEWEIQQMAEAALTSYEFSCCWNAAFVAAVDFAADEFGVKATRAQAATAINIAKTGWIGVRMSVKSIIYNQA